MTTSVHSESSARRLGPGLVAVAFLGAVIGGVGAPLITSVALRLDVPLDAAQWTLTVTLFAGAISAPILGRLGSGAHRRSTLLATLALGGLFTALPLPFGVLLIGRALQGLGLGSIALLMAVARDHLPARAAESTIATISVASTVGIGVAYPVMGLLDQVAGLRAAYAVGFALSLAAVVIVWVVVPRDLPSPSPRIDALGATLLALGTLGILVAVAQRSVWSRPWLGASILAAAAVALIAWVIVERRVAAPLVDLTMSFSDSALRANTAMFTAGIGMYLLFSLLTRYVQTPSDAGYGFGLVGAVAGASLIPFSVLGFLAGRVAPRLTRRFDAPRTFTIYAALVVVAAALFAIEPESLAVVLISMGLLGFCVGGASAVMPRLVLDGAPQSETASVLSVNQIVRAVGFSIGSALAGLLLATATPDGALIPREHGYVVAGLVVLPLLALSVMVIMRGPVPSATTRASA